MKHTPVPEIIEGEIRDAINIPGLQHIRTRVETHGDGISVDGEGTITFLICGQDCGVSLKINADGSFVLRQPDEPRAIAWPARQATQENVKPAVIDALRAVVRAAA